MTVLWHIHGRTTGTKLSPYSALPASSSSALRIAPARSFRLSPLMRSLSISHKASQRARLPPTYRPETFSLGLAMWQCHESLALKGFYSKHHLIGIISARERVLLAWRCD